MFLLSLYSLKNIACPFSLVLELAKICRKSRLDNFSFVFCFSAMFPILKDIEKKLPIKVSRLFFIFLFFFVFISIIILNFSYYSMFCRFIILFRDYGDP